MSKNYYDILGISKDASESEIKKAYRKMAIKYHPDKTSGDKEAEEKFKEASEAYEVLSNADKKSNYDRFGSVDGNPFGGNRQYGHGFDMDDIFSQFGDIFGGGFGNRQSRKRQRRGSDLRIKVNLTIKDILEGTTKKLKYKRQDKCNTCDGKGGKDVRTCLVCNGNGQRIVIQNTPFGQIQQQANCTDCHGTGEQVVNKCGDCNGEGTNLKEEIVEVDIPAGVSAGMQLKMDGYGSYTRGGMPGDLHITVDEIREFYFKRDRNNIIVEKDISVLDAILGSNVKVKTPHGDIKVSIDKGTQHGKTIRMRGKGIPDVKFGLGDLYVVVNVKIPTELPEKDINILKKLRKSKNFEV